MISAKAPGKLYIAGEYAVVNAGYPAVLVAVDRFITVTISSADEEGTLISKQYTNLPMKWKRINGKLVIEKRDNPFHYIVEAIQVVEEYVSQLNIVLELYDLHVDSELDSPQGAKYGLGSSAAVTIATIRALFDFYGVKQDDFVIYKLASLAHLNLGSNGSFGDLAASTFTGWISYQSFDRAWVLQKQKELSLLELVKLHWPKLQIEKLSQPTDLDLIIGWTQSPASTHKLVDEVKNQVDLESYSEFLNQSYDVVSRLIDGLKTNNNELIYSMITKNRDLLKSLYPLIETTQLQTLIEIALDYGVAKTSGAGGGDCGIVLVKKDQDVGSLFKRWQAKNVEILDLKVYDRDSQKKGMCSHES